MNNQFDYMRYLNLVVARPGLFFKVSLSIMTIVVLVSYVLPKKYAAESIVFIEQSVINDLVKGIAITPSIDAKVRVLNQAIKARSLLLQVIKDLDLDLAVKNDLEREDLILDIQDRMVIALDEKRGLFTLQFTDENPRIARDFVNGLVRRYIEQQTSNKREQSYEANRFLAEQIDNFKQKIDKAEQDLNEYKREKGMVLTMDDGYVRREIEQAEQKLATLRIQRNESETQRNLILKASPAQERLITLQRKLAELQATYTDSHPDVIRLKSEVAKTQAEVGSSPASSLSATERASLERYNVELTANKAMEAHLEREIASNKELLREIPTTKDGLLELIRQRDQQKLIYEQLVARYGQSEVSKQMEIQDKSATFRIIDPAVLPPQPVSPKRVRIMLMGIVGGFAGGIGVLLLLDLLKGTVKSVAEIKAMGLPVVAIIPRMRIPEELRAMRRRTRRVVAMGSAYFCIILCVLVLEAAGVKYVENMVQNLKPTQYVTMAKGYIKGLVN